MNLRILLVDDEPLALERLRAVIADATGAVAVGTARNGAEAKAQAATLRPDVVLLDIQMPGPDGLEVARILKRLPQPPEIVFVTAFDHYAAEAFDLDVSDYLLKPIRADRVQAAILRARRRLEARNAGERIEELELVVKALRQSRGPTEPRYEEEIWVPRPGGASRVPVDNIVWIEAARDYLLMHTQHRSFILRGTMADMAARLDPQKIIRVHRSAFVHKDQVDAVERAGRDGLDLILSNGTTVRVGANYRETAMNVLGITVARRSGGKASD